MLGIKESVKIIALWSKSKLIAKLKDDFAITLPLHNVYKLHNKYFKITTMNVKTKFEVHLIDMENVSLSFI